MGRQAVRQVMAQLDPRHADQLSETTLIPPTLTVRDSSARKA
jgi:DNA-binding LacI/PurR family transcriptional regulator